MDLLSFLWIIDRERWGEVPVSKSERSRGPRNYTVDYYAGVHSVTGGYYLYDPTATGFTVEPWCAKRCREGMYYGGSTFGEEAEHRRDTGVPTYVSNPA